MSRWCLLAAGALLGLLLGATPSRAQPKKPDQDLPKGWKREVRDLKPVLSPAQALARAEALRQATETWQKGEAARKQALGDAVKAQDAAWGKEDAALKAQADKETAEHQKQMQQAEAERKKLQAVVQKHTQDLEKASADAAARRKQLEETRKALQKVQKERTGRDKDVKQLQADLAKLDAELKQRRNAITDLQADLAKRRDALKALQADIGRSEAAIAKTKADLDKPPVELSKLRAKVAEREASVKKLQDDIERRREDLKKESGERRKKLEEALKKQESALAAHEADLKKKRDLAEKHSAALQKLEAALNEKQTALKKQQDELAKQQQALKAAQQELARQQTTRGNVAGYLKNEQAASGELVKRLEQQTQTEKAEAQALAALEQQLKQQEKTASDQAAALKKLEADIAKRTQDRQNRLARLKREAEARAKKRENERKALLDRFARQAKPQPQPVRDQATVYTNSVGLELVRMPNGAFRMGSPDEEEGRGDDEGPPHTVHLRKPFLMGAHEVTVGQFEAFVQATEYRTEAEKGGGTDVWMGTYWGKEKDAHWRAPGFAQDKTHPVVCVSWNDARAFCAWLSEKEGVAYRLPTEAEWEYACRAGSTSPYPWGDAVNPKLCNAAAGKAEDGHDATAPVGSYPVNLFGLCDLVGNAWEWCEDWHGDYPDTTLYDPTGPKTGAARLARGGSWRDRPDRCRSAVRDNFPPSLRLKYLGFRVVCPHVPKP